MNYIGKYIKCLIDPSILVEGIVESYSNDELILKSTNGKLLSVINNPKENIKLITIVLDIPKNTSTLIKEKEDLQKEIKQTVRTPIDDLKIKKIAELKILLNQQDKKIISEKLKDHTSSLMEVNYELPGFFKKQNIK